jgi:hypothetical protein
MPNEVFFHVAFLAVQKVGAVAGLVQILNPNQVGRGEGRKMERKGNQREGWQEDGRRKTGRGEGGHEQGRRRRKDGGRIF